MFAATDNPPDSRLVLLVNGQTLHSHQKVENRNSEFSAPIIKRAQPMAAPVF
jgi:hypothetical protein